MKYDSLILVALLLSATSVPALESSDSEHVAEIQKQNQRLVPYDLSQSLQSFTKTVHGGVQHVVAKSPANTQQIKSIQAYLVKLADEFNKGDFSVTERIHGADMPGLALLKTAKPYDIKFEYQALENGGQIHYSTEETKFVQALHLWFDAQINDHGDSGMTGHQQHHLQFSE